MKTIYDFTVKNNLNEEVSLRQYGGKVLLVVNTATECGLTPQYTALQELYAKYKEHGFEILDFPCNQFLEQAPGSDQVINEFCTLNYGTTFSRFARIDVNGKSAHALYQWLKKQPGEEKGNAGSAEFEAKVKEYTPDHVSGDIKWNFGKFLIDRKGNVAARYSPAVSPEELTADIEKLL